MAWGFSGGIRDWNIVVTRDSRCFGTGGGVLSSGFG